MVLIDNGSALNVLPLRTASELGVEATEFTLFYQKFQAYDNTKREVLGVVIPFLKFVDVLHQVEFQVLNIPTCFNLLLGHPWIHACHVVSSSLHQCAKFIHEGFLVTIRPKALDCYNIELVREALIRFQFVASEDQIPLIKDWVYQKGDRNLNIHVLDIMKKLNYFPSMGLSKH